MSSKRAILRQIRQNAPPASDLPSLESDWLRFDDPCAQFMEAVEQVGGRAIRVRDLAALNTSIASLQVTQDAKKIVSILPDVGRNDVRLSEVDRPHALEDVDVTIAGGELAVAENGAVWVSGAEIEHRAVLFLCQHLILVVSTAAVAHNLHEAYDRLTGLGLVGRNGGADQDELEPHQSGQYQSGQYQSGQYQSGRAIPLAASSYGLFISGPSKTADIEQSLVIGAQGPRTLTVLLVDALNS